MKKALLLALLLPACSDILGSERVRVPAEIAGYNADDPRIDFTFTGGVLHVSVVSYGTPCHSRGETEVRVSGRVVNVHPYDYRIERATCMGPLVTFLHEAPIPINAPGSATVRIHGRDRRVASGLPRLGGAITVERRVEIP